MIKTYSMTRPYAQDFTYCYACKRPATYWSQDEGPNWTPLGPVVYHCQKHRESAREKAGVKNTAEKMEAN